MLATIFYGGRFSIDDVQMATLSLIAYSLGLLGFTLVKILAPGYYARQDTRTPVRIGVVALVVNMLLNVVFVVPWVRSDMAGPHAGLALATSLAAFLNAGLLFRGLVRSGVWRARPGWRRLCLQAVVSAAIMATLLQQFVPEMSRWFEAGLWQRCWWLALAVAGGAAAYGGTLLATGLRPAALRMTSL